MKDETASWLSNLAKNFTLQKVQDSLFYFLILFLPTQFGKHFWPVWSYFVGLRIDYLSPTLYVTDIFVILLFLTTLLKKELRINKKFLFTVLLLSLSVFLSKNPFVGWYYLLKFLEMSYVVFFVAEALTKSKKKFFRIVLSMGIVFESLLACAQFFLHRSLGGLLYFLGERTFTSDTPGIANASIHGILVLRPYGTFSHPNVLAGFLLLGLIILWYCFAEKKNMREGYFLLMTTLIGSLGLMLTLSRTTIILGIVIILFLLGSKLYKKILFLIPIGILVLVLFPTLFYRFAPNTFEESAVTRIELFLAALHMISQHPLFGVGLGNFIPSLSSPTLYQPVHNIFILWIAETGIVGGIISILFLFSLGERLFIFWKNRTIQRRTSLFPLVILWFSIIVLGMFDHYFLTLQQGQLLLAFSLGVIFAFLKKKTV